MVIKKWGKFQKVRSIIKIQVGEIALNIAAQVIQIHGCPDAAKSLKTHLVEGSLGNHRMMDSTNQPKKFQHLHEVPVTQRSTPGSPSSPKLVIYSTSPDFCQICQVLGSYELFWESWAATGPLDSNKSCVFSFNFGRVS